MNQVSIQNAKMDAGKDFFKLMKNSNFGYAVNCCVAMLIIVFFIQYITK